MKKSIQKVISATMLFCAISTANNSYAQASSWQWADPVNGTGTNRGQSVATDASGNVYVTGVVKGTASFGTITVTTNAGSADVFIAKYDKAGNVIWAITQGGAGDDSGSGIGVDTSGNCYLTGVYASPAAFGTTTLSGQYGFNAKYDKNGNFQWANSFGPNGGDQGRGIAVSPGGNFYVSGNTSSKGFIAKYNNAGTQIWTKSASTTNAPAIAVAIDNLENSYITGNYTGSVNFGGSTVTSASGIEVYMAKFDVSGNNIGIGRKSISSGSSAFGIAADKAGNAYVCGTSDFISSFLVKFNGSGNSGWVKSIGSITGSSQLHDVDVNDSNFVYITGTGDGNGAYIAKYDTAGNQKWKTSATGVGSGQSNGISVDKEGSCYITGYGGGSSATFGTITMTYTSSGTNSIYVAKYGITGSNIGIFSQSVSDYKIQIYPNPNTGSFTVKLPLTLENSTIQILNMMGEIIYNKTLTDMDNRIDVSNVASGLYSISINNGNHVSTSKFIKQ
jgi:hypothetical protein